MDWEAAKQILTQRSKRGLANKNQTRSTRQTTGYELEYGCIISGSGAVASTSDCQQIFREVAEQQSSARITNSIGEERIPETVTFENFQFGSFPPQITHNFGTQIEVVSGGHTNLEDLHTERTAIQEVVLHAVPENVSLTSVGIALAWIPPDGSLNDEYAFARQHFTNGNHPAPRQFATDLEIYNLYLEGLGAGVTWVGGLNAVEATGLPDPVTTDGAVNWDHTFRNIFHNSRTPSWSEIYPVLAAPFQSSPTLSEGYLESHSARDRIYSTALDHEDYVPSGESRFGYIDEMTEIASVSDYWDVVSEFPSVVSEPIPIEDIRLQDGGAQLQTYLQNKPVDITSGEELQVLVDQSGETWRLYDIIDAEQFPGRIPLDSGEIIDVHVEHSTLDPDRLFSKALAHNESQWSNPRFKPVITESPVPQAAIEYRGIDASPRNKEAIDSLVAFFRVEDRVREYLAEFDIRGNASDIHPGVRRQGMDYRLPSGHTVRQAWRGIEKLNSSLLSILSAGVTELSSQAYVQDYRDIMDQHLEKTPSESIAKRCWKEGFPGVMKMSSLEV